MQKLPISNTENENSSFHQGGYTNFNNRQDSGIGKESSQDDLGDEQQLDISFYESVTPIQIKWDEDSEDVLLNQDSNSRDSGYVEVDHRPDGYITPNTFSLLDNIGEDFMEFNTLEESVRLPPDFDSLISGTLESAPSTPKASEGVGGPCKKIKLFKTSPILNGDNIKNVLQRSLTDPDLIGDFSKAYCLPFICGHHPDLKYINVFTLASIVKGEYYQILNSYKIIDCRFPYEYNGGHVRGAINLYTKDQILELFNVSEKVQGQRNILIFHCEFSSERGPGLYRFLRNIDRSNNEYPKLNFPEMYVLEGGYKKFYEQCEEFCEPKAYTTMFEEKYQDQLRFFRGKSRNWSDGRFRPNIKKFKRLGFS